MAVLASLDVPSHIPGSTEFKATGAVVLAGANRSPVAMVSQLSQNINTHFIYLCPQVFLEQMIPWC